MVRFECALLLYAPEIWYEYNLSMKNPCWFPFRSFQVQNFVCGLIGFVHKFVYPDLSSSHYLWLGRMWGKVIHEELGTSVGFFMVISKVMPPHMDRTGVRHPTIQRARAIAQTVSVCVSITDWCDLTLLTDWCDLTLLRLFVVDHCQLQHQLRDWRIRTCEAYFGAQFLVPLRVAPCIL